MAKSFLERIRNKSLDSLLEDPLNNGLEINEQVINQDDESYVSTNSNKINSKNFMKPTFRNYGPEQNPAIIQQKKRENIIKAYNSNSNKYKVIDELASENNVSHEFMCKQIFDSKAPNLKIKYSSHLKDNFSVQEAAFFLYNYLVLKNKRAQTNYSIFTNVDTSTNFYQAIDDFSEKLGLGKLRKSKLGFNERFDIVSFLDKAKNKNNSSY